GKGAAFLDGLVPRYFKLFPEGKFDHAVDPPKEWLDSVDENEPLDDLKPPVRRPSQSLAEHKEEMSKFDAYVEACFSRERQVRRFMRNHIQDRIKGKIKRDDPMAPVMKRLAGRPVTNKGNKKAAFNVWARENKVYVDELVEKKKKEHLDRGETCP
ncbi:hypothetical protein V5O48_019560, partial [Marasmius crinis-equi]